MEWAVGLASGADHAAAVEEVQQEGCGGGDRADGDGVAVGPLLVLQPDCGGGGDGDQAVDGPGVAGGGCRALVDRQKGVAE
ncbi:hypothetical protein GCM10009838_61990 [Catenulispora subtropica]|uniref:Uncharacterized protein n=1 Tax=Catenulispora subtropica TaxID=450798 RepID=A0ABP5E3U5_9ACTN